MTVTRTSGGVVLLADLHVAGVLSSIGYKLQIWGSRIEGLEPNLHSHIVINLPHRDATVPFIRGICPIQVMPDFQADISFRSHKLL
jgi:hypothetical protein